jgi:hypothetical protein
VHGGGGVIGGPRVACVGCSFSVLPAHGGGGDCRLLLPRNERVLLWVVVFVWLDLWCMLLRPPQAIACFLF